MWGIKATFIKVGKNLQLPSSHSQSQSTLTTCHISGMFLELWMQKVRCDPSSLRDTQLPIYWGGGWQQVDNTINIQKVLSGEWIWCSESTWTGHLSQKGTWVLSGKPSWRR